MNPTLKDGDFISADRFYSQINRYDIVIIKRPKGIKYIKRVIGMPGDKITVMDNNIYINNEVLNDFGITRTPEKKQEFILKKNEYYVLGDNRENSTDSRNFGPVKKNEIIGVVN